MISKHTLKVNALLSPLSSPTFFNLSPPSLSLSSNLNMGNGITKISLCFTGGGEFPRRRKDIAAVISDPVDDLGHSFCYVRPDPTRTSSSKVHSEETSFKSISGASVSANTTTSLSTDNYIGLERASSAFESSNQFSSVPLQAIPRSGPLIPGSGPMFVSGPIERGFMSGPLDRARENLFSGPIDRASNSSQFYRSFSHNSARKSGNILRVFRRAICKTVTRGNTNIQNSIVAPIKGILSIKEQDWAVKQNELTISSEGSLDDGASLESQNLQWAQGKAGEDRVHVVVSEEHGWVFVGIYDGFNGPDAPDYLLSNLYSFVYKELKGVLWDDKPDSSSSPVSVRKSNLKDEAVADRTVEGCSRCIEEVNYPISNNNCELRSRKKRGKVTKSKWEENQRRWKCEWDRERLELDRRLKEQLNKNGSKLGSINHSDVLKALSQGLKKTEEAYLDVADKMLDENPELALMGSCVLVMLMKGEDVYVMNVGDSRAVLAQKSEPDLFKKDLERIKEETMLDLEGFDHDDDEFNVMPSLCASQLTMDHSTSEEEEVQRIKSEHPDDACAVMNDRVKGSLKVTRAFGAGFLKQPKWNDALLEMFRIDYVGTSPYITCSPFLYHHKLGPRDRFLILSSDGLYQYFTNEEAVSEVELFIALWPEGDPAQHLVEEVLFRAAKKAGLDFHELLEIPQGDRRRYHDDVSIIVISLEGRIWRYCV